MINIDTNPQYVILNAVYKDGHPTVSFKVDDFTLWRDVDMLGMLGQYQIRCVFYRNSSYTTHITEDILIKAINDFCAGLISSMDFVYNGKTRGYRAITSPDVEVTSEEIIISCKCRPFPLEHTPNVSLPGSYIPNIIEVIFNNPATIVYWSDGSKTVVKACDKDTFDKETGLAMAIAKKALSYKCLQPRARFKHIVKSAKDYSDNQ